MTSTDVRRYGATERPQEAREMAYDDSAFRRRDTNPTNPMSRGGRDDSRYSGESSYRDHDFGPSAYESSDYREPDTIESTLGLHRRVPPAVLDDVFDDPEHGDPGRDRMVVHLLWEAALLAAAGAAAYLVYRQDSTALRGDSLEALFVLAAALGLLAIGAGLTLRASAVNLAIGPIAVAAALHFAENGDRGLVSATAPAIGAAAVVGLALAILVTVFHVPGWAASLAAGLAVVVFIEQRNEPVTVQGDFDPTAYAPFLFGGMAALAVLGGLLGTVKPVRRTLGRFRPVADPARRRGRLPAVVTGGAIVLSMVFAAGGGVLLGASSTTVVPQPGFDLLGLALGAALLGGTSAYGRRGGIFGTVLAVVLIVLAIRYFDLRNWDITYYAIGAAAMAAGLVITRIVETFGRPASARVEAEPEWSGPANAADPTANWSSPRQETWSSALPAEPTAGRPDPWDGDRWGIAR
ncbi:MAG TPA: ABC transporter permease [Pilimelia sp.]|nr:ABC transporter permease [Pilimelia sp.]